MDPISAIATALGQISQVVGVISTNRSRRLAQDDINLGLFIEAQAEEDRQKAQQQNLILLLLFALAAGLVLAFIFKKKA